MRYLTVSADYNGACVHDEIIGSVPFVELDIPLELFQEIDEWNSEYKKIIPLSMNERKKKHKIIENLDLQGIELAKKLRNFLKDSKIKYYSEGKLQYIEYE